MMVHSRHSSTQSNGGATAVKSAVSLGRGLFGPSYSAAGVVVVEVDILKNEDQESAPRQQVPMFSSEIDKLSSWSGHSVASTVPCSSDDGSDDEQLLVVEDEDADGKWNSSNVDKISKLWELSTKQRSELEQMGRRLQDIDHFKNTPAEVIRFIRARPGDLDAAETMFRNMIDWRSQSGADTILQDYQPPQFLVDYFPSCTLESLDKDGDSSICVDRGGCMDYPGLVARFGHDELMRFLIWLREHPRELKWTKEFEAKNGRPWKQQTIIEDISCASLAHLSQLWMDKEARNMLGEITQMDQDYYPENVKRIIVIGVPSAFMVVWKAVKHLFDDGLREKMVFASTKGAAKVLAKYVDLEVLPDCIVPGIGKGRAIEGMSNDLTGGPVPLNS